MVIEGITIIEIIIGQIIEIYQEADGTTICQVIGAIIIRITIDEVVRVQYVCKVQNGWLVYSPMLIPRQLRFSLYSGTVITEGLM